MANSRARSSLIQYNQNKSKIQSYSYLGFSVQRNISLFQPTQIRNFDALTSGELCAPVLASPLFNVTQHFTESMYFLLLIAHFNVVFNFSRYKKQQPHQQKQKLIYQTAKKKQNNSSIRR